MPATADSILAHLSRVDAERLRRQTAPGLAAKVDAIKRYQQRRFSLTYADLLTTARYGAAARFFLDELYGPGDFSTRDSQFARVVPAIVRLFPREIVDTVSALAGLHDLSESLDTAMGMVLTSVQVDAQAYTAAWQRASDPTQRGRQISLTVSLGWSLDQLTRKTLLRKSLRMMRGPALAAGLGDLQGLLERGFDAFATMRGAQEFLAMVESREQNLATRLFAANLSGREWSRADSALLGLP